MTALRSSFGPALALLFNAAVWGLSWWPMRALLDMGLHPLWANVGLFLIGCVLIVLWRPQALRQLRERPVLWTMALASGVVNAAFNWGVSIGEVVRVVLLFYLMPVWTALLARLWLGVLGGFAFACNSVLVRRLAPVTRDEGRALAMLLGCVGVSGLLALTLGPVGGAAMVPWPPAPRVDWLALLVLAALGPSRSGSGVQSSPKASRRTSASNSPSS